MLVCAVCLYACYLLSRYGGKYSRHETSHRALVLISVLIILRIGFFCLIGRDGPFSHTGLWKGVLHQRRRLRNASIYVRD